MDTPDLSVSLVGRVDAASPSSWGASRGARFSMDLRRPIIPMAHGECERKTASHLSWFLAILVSMALAFVPVLSAQDQSAGQISRQIPIVNLQHGLKVQPASDGSKVVWGDLVTTDRGGRARISLDDGSILN